MPVEQSAPVEPEEVVEEVEVEVLEVVFPEQTKVMSGLQSKAIPLALQHSNG